MVRSADGEAWTKEPELIYAHPFGGSQDPCLLKLRDGIFTLHQLWLGVCQAGWDRQSEKPIFINSGMLCFGGYLVRSLMMENMEGPGLSVAH